MRTLSSTFNSIQKVPKIKIKAPAALKWIAKVNDGTLYIFTVNTGDSSFNAEFTVSGKTKFVKRINLGKDRMPQKIENTTYSWSDGFTKNEVHIYTIKLK